MTAIDHDAGAITFQPNRGGGQVTLPSAYLDAGRVDYGYARTVHGAQGSTCDVALTLGDASVYNEMFYVQMSRARSEVRIYATATPPTIADTMDTPVGAVPEEPDPLRDVTVAAGQSRAKHLAVDAVPVAPAHELAAERRELAEALSVIPPDQSDASARLATDRDRLADAVAEVRDALVEIGAPSTSEPASRSSRRRQLLDDLDDVQARITDVTGRIGEVEAVQGERRRLLGEWAPEVARHHELGAQIETEVRYRVAAQTARPTHYVIDELGERPTDPVRRQQWDHAVTEIERYRAEWAVSDQDRALGPEVAGAQAQHRSRVAAQLDRVRPAPALGR